MQWQLMSDREHKVAEYITFVLTEGGAKITKPAATNHKYHKVPEWKFLTCNISALWYVRKSNINFDVRLGTVAVQWRSAMAHVKHLIST